MDFGADVLAGGRNKVGMICGSSPSSSVTFENGTMR